MKILWLSHLIPFPPKGGVLQRSYNLIKELSNYHQVDLLAFNQHKLIGPLFESVKTGVKEAQSALSAICRQLEFFEIDIDRFTLGRYALALKSLIHDPYTINWLKSKTYSRAMTDWIRQNDYDLVHFDTISLVPFFHLVPPYLHTSLDHHNIESHMLLRRANNEKNFLKCFYFWQEGMRLARYERRFCPRFSLNITCSDIDTKRLMELSPQSSAYTIPNGVDYNFFKPQGLSSHANRLVFVGRMSAYPNIDAVLFIAKKLWPNLKKKHSDLVCDIVGSNPPASIRALENQLQDFHIHGYVDDIRPTIEKATIYICPIRDGGGTKLKILDAMSMGKAIVAHPLACEGINVTNGHNVLLAENATMFIKHIDYLLMDINKRKVLGAAARRLVKKSYGFHAIGKQLSDLFQNIVNANIDS